MNKITYSKSGVDYQAMDPLKRLAQKQAGKTAVNLHRFGLSEITASRGESAYVFEESDCYRAFVIEGLGSKNLVADAVRKFTYKSHYEALAQDTVAMIINDLVVVGADPQVVNAYFAVGNSDWFADKKRSSDLVNGWASACTLSGAVWGGGETPTLKGVIVPGTIDLAGSASGIIKPKRNLTLGEKLVPGDRILLIESSGIHANGLTLARTIADKLPKGYRTLLSDGKTFGESLLIPTHIYAPLVRDCFKAGIDLHYMVNITGHGWRKLMRANRDFSYVLEKIPDTQPLFSFIQKHSGNDDKEMYGNFNMGAGFALMMPEKYLAKAQKIARKHHLNSLPAGYAEKGSRQVYIKPKNITYRGKTLDFR